MASKSEIFAKQYRNWSEKRVAFDSPFAARMLEEKAHGYDREELHDA